MHLSRIVFLILFFALATLVAAQGKPDFKPPSLDDETIPVLKVELPLEEGKLAERYFRGITGDKEDRIAINKLGYFVRPVLVQLRSEDGGELEIEFVKQSWDDIVRSGETENGTYRTSFKAGYAFGIKVRGKAGIPYVLAIAAGDELLGAGPYVVAPERAAGEETIAAETQPASAPTEESGGFSWASIGLFAAVIVIVFLSVQLRKKRAATLIVFALGGWGTLAAEVDLAKFVDLGEMGENMASAAWDWYKGGNEFNLDFLSDDDREFEPDFDTNTLPDLPPQCAEVDIHTTQAGACVCLEKAYEELADISIVLERLRIIAQHNQKVVDKGISFGDNFSGVHAVHGLAWQQQRSKIMKSVETFDRSYQRKYREFIDKLYKNLLKIDGCQDELGNPNWYDNSGFMLYTMKKERYASYK